MRRLTSITGGDHALMVLLTEWGRGRDDGGVDGCGDGVISIVTPSYANVMKICLDNEKVMQF
jgi:hypothetical protein